MRLYHGSNMRVTDIDLLKSRPAKDFGRAFYLSADREQAVDLDLWVILQDRMCPNPL